MMRLKKGPALLLAIALMAIVVTSGIAHAAGGKAVGLKVAIGASTPRLYMPENDVQQPVKISLGGYVDGAVSIHVRSDVSGEPADFQWEGPGNRKATVVLNKGLLARNPITVKYDGNGSITITVAKGWSWYEPDQEEKDCFIICW